MLETSIIEQAIKSYDDGTKRINDFISKHPNHKLLAEKLQNLFDKNDEMHRSLMKVFCEFSVKFIERKIKESQLKFNQEEDAVITTLKYFPKKITKQYSIKRNEIAIVFVDVILENSQKYNNSILEQSLDSFVRILETSQAAMDRILPTTMMPHYQQEHLNMWLKQTAEIKDAFLKYLQHKMQNKTDTKMANDLLNNLKKLLNIELSPRLKGVLNVFRASMDHELETIQFCVQKSQMYLKIMIDLNPTFVFSDVNHLQNTVEYQKNAFTAFKAKYSDKERIWLNKFIELLNFFKRLFAIVNVRALNIPFDSIEDVYSLIRGDPTPEHNVLAPKFMNAFNGYKELYTPTILINDQRIRDFIEFDYEQRILKRWEEKIKKMENNEQLNKLLKDANTAVLVGMTKVIPKVKTLSADYGFAIKISDIIRSIFCQFYGLYKALQMSEYSQTESQIIINGIDGLKGLVDQVKQNNGQTWRIQTNIHADTVKKSVNECFKKLINLPNEINAIFEKMP